MCAGVCDACACDVYEDVMCVCVCDVYDVGVCM